MATLTNAVDDGQVTAEKVAFAVRKIVDLAKPLRIIAFGSRARGTHQPDSDLDLAVIVEKYDREAQPRPIFRADLDVWMSIDLLVVDSQRYEFMKSSIISVHHEIANEGVVLYDARIGSVDLGAVERIAR
jgi:predicted nucleotidyltransferase